MTKKSPDATRTQPYTHYTLLDLGAPFDWIAIIMVNKRCLYLPLTLAVTIAHTILSSSYTGLPCYVRRYQFVLVFLLCLHIGLGSLLRK